MTPSAALLALKRWRQQRPTHPIIVDLRQRKAISKRRIERMLKEARNVG